MSGFDESKHPRDNHGRFASGGGGHAYLPATLHAARQRAHTGGAAAYGGVPDVLQTRGESAKQRLAHLSPAVAHNLTVQRYTSRARATVEARRTVGAPSAHVRPINGAIGTHRRSK